MTTELDFIAAQIAGAQEALGNAAERLGQLLRLETLESKIDLVIALLNQATSMEVQQLDAIEQLRASSQSIRTAVESVGTSVSDLATRLGNNPSEAEVAAIASDLGALATTLGDTKTAIDAIDPDVPGGVVPGDDGEPVVEEPVEGEAAGSDISDDGSGDGGGGGA